jgi:hypothetical protein
MKMNKQKRYIIIVLFVQFVIISAAVGYAAPQEERITDPYAFMGDWVATEYYNTHNFQMKGADEHLGNKIYLKPDSFYSDYLEGFPVINVSEYFVESQSDYDFQINYKIWLSELGIEGDYVFMLCATERNAYSHEMQIGIIIDADTLICDTGTGWYLYKRVGPVPGNDWKLLSADKHYMAITQIETACGVRETAESGKETILI